MCAFVHSSTGTGTRKFNMTYRSTEYLLPQVTTVQDVVPPRRKNEHTLDNLRGKCPMIVPDFSAVTAYRPWTLCGSLTHSSTSPAAASHIYMVAENATISSQLLSARSLTHGRIHDVTLRPMYMHAVKKFSPSVTTKFFLHEILSYEIFSTRIFSNLRYTSKSFFFVSAAFCPLWNKINIIQNDTSCSVW